MGTVGRLFLGSYGKVHDMRWFDEGWRVYAFLLLTGFMIIFFRAEYAIFSPVVFTEDGFWLGNRFLCYDYGYALYCRYDYLIFGNILMIQLAFYITRLFWGYSLLQYPVVLAVLSFVFFDLLAFSTVFYLKRLLSFFSRVILFYSILLLPMGEAVCEMYGRASNIGYGCFFIGFVVMLWFLFDKEQGLLKRQMSFAVLLFCAMTNPGTYLLLGLVFVHEFWSRWRDGSLRDILPWVGLSLATLPLMYYGSRRVKDILLVAYGFDMDAGLQAAAQITVNWAEAVEFFCRSCLYSFVWPVYTAMTDKLSIGLLVVFVLFLLAAGYYADWLDRRMLMVTSGGLLFFSVITLLMRPNLTASSLHGYATSYPDRYFYVQNLLVLLLLSMVLSICQKSLTGSTWVRAILMGFCLWVFILPIWKSNVIFEGKTPRLSLMDVSKCFGEQITDAYHEQGEQEKYKVITVPAPNWWIMIPRKYMEASVKDYESKR